MRSAIVPIVGLLFLVGAASAQTSGPAIIREPTGGTVGTGEQWVFEVEALGAAPLSYRWYQDTTAIPAATNSVLTITNATSAFAGVYTVIITNSFGIATSEPATLRVSETPPRLIRNGSLLRGGVIRIPMLFSGNGQESAISFSLKFDPGVLTNPDWENRGTNDITGTNAFSLDLTQATNGFVGLRVDRPGNFPQRTYELGVFTFDLVSTNDPFAAALQFTNTPTAAEALTFSGDSLGMQAAVIPQIELVDATPVLNRQSGLIEQLLTISYPGTLTITNVDIAVGNLGEDQLGNRVELYNRIGTKTIDTTGYGDEERLPFASAGDFGPGTQKLLSMEYHVLDKVSIPDPAYYLDLGVAKQFILPNAATPLNITTNRYLNGTFVIQFPTILNYLYYVNYAESVDDLVNQGPTSRYVDPPIVGTGFSIQWIDNGPPKTISRPVDGTRFYRVVELPVNN